MLEWYSSKTQSWPIPCPKNMQKKHVRLPSGQGSKPQTSGIGHSLQQNVTITIYLGEFHMASPVVTDGAFCFFQFFHLRIHAGLTKAGCIFRSSIIIFADHQDHPILPVIRKVTKRKKRLRKKIMKRVKKSPSHDRGCISSLSKLMIPICFVIESPKHTSGTGPSVPPKSAGKPESWKVVWISRNTCARKEDHNGCRQKALQKPEGQRCLTTAYKI